MEHDWMEHNNGRHASVSTWVLIGFLAVAAFFLWTEHRAHVLGALPYLLFLACPLMHLFHHHGHGHHHGGDPQAEPDGQRPLSGKETP
jgi:hypothetical protein